MPFVIDIESHLLFKEDEKKGIKEGIKKGKLEWFQKLKEKKILVDDYLSRNLWYCFLRYLW